MDGKQSDAVIEKEKNTEMKNTENNKRRRKRSGLNLLEAVPDETGCSRDM